MHNLPEQHVEVMLCLFQQSLQIVQILNRLLRKQSSTFHRLTFAKHKFYIN
jgi:hypothetical protein